MNQDRVHGIEKIKNKRISNRKTKNQGKKPKRGIPVGLINRDIVKYILYDFNKLLKHLMPKKFEASGTIGFDDPYHTSIFCMLMEIFRGYKLHDIQIQYVFYEEVYEGKFYLEGKIRLIYIAYIAIKLMLNKSVRKMILNNS
ncbi:hypothetical protein Q5O14_08845 [Eubacteriaceae bacterium ES2]|nr:hypothetical protein Q5O14_08845 [Eubacteriaceae bacterium ES2]